MDHSHPRRVRTPVLIAAGLVGVALAPRLALLMLSVGVGLVVGTVLLGVLAFWAVRCQARRLLREQQATCSTARVVDGVIVEAR